MAYNVKRFVQNYFTPKNPHKLVTPLDKLKAKSSWEFDFFKKMDEASGIIKWGYECVPIPYIKPTDGLKHNYFVDIWAIQEVDKVRKVFLFEIKPEKFVKFPKEPKKMTPKSKANYEAVYSEVKINHAKFNAARVFARENGMTFIVICYKFDKKNGNKPILEQIVWK